jgi:hypothetical protein
VDAEGTASATTFYVRDDGGGIAKALVKSDVEAKIRTRDDVQINQGCYPLDRD